MKREVAQWKKDAVDALADIMEQHKVFGLIDLAEMPDYLIQQMRRMLRGKALFRMAKKSLLTRALEKYQKKSKKKNLVEFGEYVRGQTTIIFADIDPFELKVFFEENKMKTFAKGGDTADEDVIVPAGDTLLPPGQVISELNLTLRLPTRIQSDSIWVTEDTVTHEKGDLISLKEAVALRKLNIKPIELSIKFYCAWNDGEIVPESVLTLNVEEFKQDVVLAVLQAKQLAIEMGIITEDNIVDFLNQAIRSAFNVALEMPFIVDEMLDEYVKRAELNAKLVYQQVLGEKIETENESETKKSKPKEVKKEDDEDESPPGLGSLFG